MEQKRCYGCMKLKPDSPVCPYCGYDERIPGEPHRLPAGTVLKEQYLVGKVLGQGGFGITYLGWDLYLDIPVAIKEYYPVGVVMRDTTVTMDVVSCTGDEGTRFRNNKERFLREAKMLARFSQVPEIVQVRNFFLSNNTAYIVMEYVEGITLKQFVQDNGGALGVEQTLSILRPMIEALCKIHKAGLVHRDISPDNIMMLPGGGVKLLDFGAVRDVGEASVDKPLTKSTEAILKQGYAPIEQYQKRGGLGPWTDVYALCATICYCITGEIPPDAPERLLGYEDLNLKEKVPSLSEAQVKALEHGMALRVENRTTSMDALYEELFGGKHNIKSDENEDSRCSKIAHKETPHISGQPEDRKTGHTGKTAQAPGKKHSWNFLIGAAGILTAAAVAIGMLLIIGGVNKLSVPDPTTPATKVFDGEPVTIYVESEDAQSAFRAALEGDAREVILGGGQDLHDRLTLINDPIVIDKPVLVEQGVSLALFCNMTITSRGSLTVEGKLSAYASSVRTTGGGSIHIASTGFVGNDDCLYLLENEGDLTADKGAKVDISVDNGAIRFLDEEALRESALEIANQADFRSNCHGEQPMVLKNSVTLEEYTDVTVPVIVPEGTTLTIPEGVSISISGTVLINHGTVHGCVELKDGGLIYNSGTMTIANEPYWEGGSVVNEGNMTISGNANDTSLFNSGSLWLDDHYNLNGSSLFLNSGTLTIAQAEQKEEKWFDISSGSRLVNTGDMRLQKKGSCNICGELINWGSIRGESPDTRFHTGGLFRNPWTGSSFSTMGEYINYGLEMTVPGASVNTGDGHSIPFGGEWMEEQNAGMLVVSTPEELMDALNDPNCHYVQIMNQCNIQVEGDLVVTKGLAFPPDEDTGLSIRDGRLILSGPDAYLFAGSNGTPNSGLNLNGGELVIDDAAAIFTGPGGIAGCGGIRVGGNGKLLLRNTGDRPCPDGIGIELLYGGQVKMLAPLTLREVQMTIDGAGSFEATNLTLERCKVSVRNGQLVNGGALFIDAGSTVTVEENGYLGYLNGATVNGKLENRGKVHFEGGEYLITGSFTNYGQMLWHDADVKVIGNLENRGWIGNAENSSSVSDYSGFSGNAIETCEYPLEDF